jgi:hypothetical protein
MHCFLGILHRRLESVGEVLIRRENQECVHQSGWMVPAGHVGIEGDQRDWWLEGRT